MAEAKTEADKEISKYRDQQEEIFEEERAEQERRMDDLSEIEAKAEAEIAEIKEEFEANKEEVVEFLIESIKSVSLKVPKVVKGNFEDMQI
mmetsp:Transcript_10714/g.10595  ORF Transcript_10714/g.10595 Transcript_10714/m.10595 type:complete len:91 (+) Transcript_10714:47-319(+)